MIWNRSRRHRRYQCFKVSAAFAKTETRLKKYNRARVIYILHRLPNTMFEADELILHGQIALLHILGALSCL